MLKIVIFIYLRLFCNAGADEKLGILFGLSLSYIRKGILDAS